MGFTARLFDLLGVSEIETPPALKYTRYYYPLVLFLFFIISLTAWGIATSQASAPKPPPVDAVLNGDPDAAAKRRRRRELAEKNRGRFNQFAARFPGGVPSAKEADERRLSPLRKALLNWLLAGVLMTLVGNATNVILHALAKRGWWCGKDYVISNVGLFFIYGLLLISQLDNRLNPTAPHLGAWIIGLSGEVAVVRFKIQLYDKAHQVWNGRHIRWGSWQIVDLSIDLLRIALLLLLIGIYVCLIVAPTPVKGEDGAAEERTGLLNGSASNGVADYGSNPPHRKHGLPEPSVEAPAGWGRRTTVGKQSWWEYLRGYAIFFPYLWPSKQRRLQMLMVVCFVLVLLQRGVNVLVPHQLGTVTNILSGEEGPPRLPWTEIALYVAYRFLQGNMGILGAMRSALWIPVGQYSYQALSTSAFEHVHSLSLDFHLGKKTGEVLSALSKGSAINNFLEMVSFQVVPMLVDLAVAVGYFLIKFDAYYALIVAVVTFLYLYLTVRLAQWRADIRREMVNKSREEDAVKNDSMIAYETVKYFNAERYEFGRYREAVKAFQRAEYRVSLSLNIMNVSQNVVFTLGLLVACFLSAYQVSTGQAKVGRFVSLLTYLAQLQGPLNFFGTFYRSIQSSMINSERMLELFKEQPTVVDPPNAKTLTSCTGLIRFRDVHFSYDSRRDALKGLDFTAAPGTTTAFVGESGGGKTTVLRLLFRFYNVTSGAIEMDNQDVRDLTIDSVREKIGVVPQDTVLFNETVMYNLKYANQSATDEEVYAACRAASIHDKILSFPDGYNTKVGERGLRLSGGEKQRVAIARTILKNPKIILLDEATAALDSETEQHIQAALRELSKGRTTLVIAHRLSTITTADQILCMHEGRVVERGTHEELLALGGKYKDMWSKQIRAQKVEKAKAKLDEMGETPVVSSSSSSADSGSDEEAKEGGKKVLGKKRHGKKSTKEGDVNEGDQIRRSESSGDLEGKSAQKGKWTAQGLRKALAKKQVEESATSGKEDEQEDGKP